jgi:hypothetical protein
MGHPKSKIGEYETTFIGSTTAFTECVETKSVWKFDRDWFVAFYAAGCLIEAQGLTAYWTS